MSAEGREACFPPLFSVAFNWASVSPNYRG